MKIKEDIRFRALARRRRHLFMIKSKTIFEFRGRHEVLDADGAVIGILEKEFGRSLLRSHWYVRDPSGPEGARGARVELDRRPAAPVRRPGARLPLAATWLPFNFTLRRDGEEVGRYKRVLGKLRDRYVLELGPGASDVDRRLLVAFTIGLDALQDR